MMPADTGLPLPRLPYTPGLFDGVAHTTVALPEYDELYRMLVAQQGAPLLALLRARPLLRIPVPADLRQRQALFRGIHTQVTRTLHSQTPHIDFPHPPGDPRRFNLFWAEAPRQGAVTYFIPRDLSDAVADAMTAYIAENPDIQQASAPVLERYAADEGSLSRYPLPADVVEGYRALVFAGDARLWSQLSDFGKTTICARVLGNTEAGTRCVEHVLSCLGGRFWVERWQEPAVVLMDDTRLLHGRLGRGDSGGRFYRIWLSGPPGEHFGHYRQDAAATASCG